MGQGQSFIEACATGNVVVVQNILDHGADPNQMDENRVSAVHWASNNGHDEVVWVLIAAKAIVNTQSKLGQSPLWSASFSGHQKCVKLLIDAGANVDMQKEDGFTALYVAAQEGHLMVVELLIAAKADVNIQTNNNWSALYVASNNGHYEVVRVLLAAKATVDTQTKSGETPLMAAISHGHQKCAELLIDAGTNVKVEVSEGPRRTVDEMTSSQLSTSVHSTDKPTVNLSHTDLYENILEQSRITVEDLKKETGVTDDQLNQKCTLKHLRDISPYVGNFLKFASHFNLPPGDLAGINVNLNLSFKQKTETVFLWWQANIQNATYLSFVQTCLDPTVSEGDIARKMSRLCADIGINSIAATRQKRPPSASDEESSVTGQKRPPSASDEESSANNCKLPSDLTLTVDHTMTVVTVLNDARKKWYFIGEGIGCKSADLNEIRDRNPSYQSMCLLELLRHRIQQGGLTCSMLCTSLRGELVGRDDVAKNIEALALRLLVEQSAKWNLV